MDLGKMLAEALANSPAARVVEGKWDPVVSLDDREALATAAKAFLAMVRHAEGDIDYRDLLHRYMCHVGECEGVTFVHRIGRDGSGERINFTAAQADTLREIDALPVPANHIGNAE